MTARPAKMVYARAAPPDHARPATPDGAGRPKNSAGGGIEIVVVMADGEHFVAPLSRRAALRTLQSLVTILVETDS